MSKIQVKVSSITNAERGRKILEDNGIKAVIKRSSEIAADEGCGYSIFFNSEKEKGIALLRKAGVRIVGIAEV